MRIPVSFRLMAHTIKVRAVPFDKWRHEDHVGRYDADKQLIEVRHQPGTQSEHIYTHELVHAILTAMGHPLNQDEGFVDNFSGLLHQAMTTSRYAEPRPSRRPRKKNSAHKTV